MEEMFKEIAVEVAEREEPLEWSEAIKYGKRLLEGVLDEFSFLFWAMVAIVGVLAVIGVVTYVIRALTYGSFSKLRGVKNSWLAWLPFGWSVALGNIAKDIDVKNNGITRKWGGALVLQELAFLLLFGGGVGLTMFSGLNLLNEGIETTAVILFGGALLLLFLAVVMGITFLICKCICTYKMFEVIVPGKALKYMFLSVLVPVAYAVCLIKCRKEVTPKKPVAPVKVAAPASVRPAPVQQTTPVAVRPAPAPELIKEAAPAAVVKPVQNSLSDTNRETPTE